MASVGKTSFSVTTASTHPKGNWLGVVMPADIISGEKDLGDKRL